MFFEVNSPESHMMDLEDVRLEYAPTSKLHPHVEHNTKKGADLHALPGITAKAKAEVARLKNVLTNSTDIDLTETLQQIAAANALATTADGQYQALAFARHTAARRALETPEVTQHYLDAAQPALTKAVHALNTNAPKITSMNYETAARQGLTKETLAVDESISTIAYILRKILVAPDFDTSQRKQRHLFGYATYTQDGTQGDHTEDQHRAGQSLLLRFATQPEQTLYEIAAGQHTGWNIDLPASQAELTQRLT